MTAEVPGLEEKDIEVMLNQSVLTLKLESAPKAGCISATTDAVEPDTSPFGTIKRPTSPHKSVLIG
ncbi:hypothetical protein FHW02_004268 [Ochrobactrum sp. RH1CCR137]|nr:hypothetical protein [Ochrobactrum sp. RH1CCR137]MBA8857964.1 hypothetical protein [Ochrobactrum sp. RH1CCR134]